MELLIALALTALLALAGRKALAKRAWPLCAVLAVLAGCAAFLPLSFVPLWARAYLLDLFRKGYLATAFFAVVMVTGALKNGSPLMKALMPQRSALSLGGGVLMLGHIAACVATLLRGAATGEAGALQWVNIALSVLLLCLLLLLWITSFPAIRREMGPVRWKRVQRWAYAFYALSYIHLMVVGVPHVLEGKTGSLLSAVLYTLLFFLYAAFRLRKARKSRSLLLPLLALVLSAAVFLPLRQYAGSTGRAAAQTAQAAQAAPDGSGEPSSEEPPAAPVAPDADADSPYADGVWQGEAMGYNGPITASVTIAGGIITDVAVVSHADDEPYYSDAAEVVLPAIVEAQSTWVDAVTGATTTSWGLMDAAQAALDAAAN